jgi:hypothetical protein
MWAARRKSTSTRRRVMQSFRLAAKAAMVSRAHQIYDRPRITRVTQFSGPRSWALGPDKRNGRDPENIQPRSNVRYGSLKSARRAAQRIKKISHRPIPIIRHKMELSVDESTGARKSRSLWRVIDEV